MGKKKLSVEEILAAARRADSGGGGDAPAEPPPEPEAEAPEQGPEGQAAEEQAAAPAKPTASGERPSVADMLAMARGEKKGGGKPAAKPKPAAEKKPAAKPAAKKSKESPAAPASGPRSTASILEAARAEAKRGPKSKSEAGIAPEVDDYVQEDKPVKAKPKAKPTVPPMPAKPDYAKKPAKKPTTEERRGFVTMFGLMVGTFLGIGFTSLTATLTMWTLGLARFMFPNILIEPPSRFKIGFPSEFAPDQVMTKFKAQFGIWVVNGSYNGVPQVYALSTVCTHLGCTPNWLEAEQKFKCPCHGSGFYKDGINFEGPAPRPLERYAIRLAEDGQLEVDKSRKFQEEKGEWASPDCFVAV